MIRYAVKKLKQPIISIQDFKDSEEMREAKLYYDLPEYEHIVKYYDCFLDDSNYFYLVLEYCVSKGNQI